MLGKPSIAFVLIFLFALFAGEQQNTCSDADEERDLREEERHRDADGYDSTDSAPDNGLLHVAR